MVSLAEHGLEPTLLIASPQMTDPVFGGTLVLLWHHDEDGAIGVVINRPIEQPFSEVLALDEVELGDYPNGHVSWGGPVNLDTGTIITSTPIEGDEHWAVGNGLFVTRSQEALVVLLEQQAALLLCLGYAGWGPGQLDREIEEGGWLFADVDPKIVLDTNREQIYERALASLGLTPTTVWMQPIDA